MSEIQQGGGRSSSDKYEILALTKIIDCEALKHTGSVANEERAVVVGDGDHQRAAKTNHEVRHGQAEEDDVHGVEERRVPQHHRDDQAVVED